MKTNVYVFLFDGFSDWEIAYLMPELRKDEKISLKTFTGDGSGIVSMGGLRVTPDLSLSDIDINDVSLLVLPGGTAWEENRITAIDGFVAALSAADRDIAAICGATVYLGERGYLDEVKHTSIDLNYLKAVAPHYKGDKYYQPVNAVSDKNIITANGIAPIEFAREVFRKIKLYDEAMIDKWFQLFKNGIWTG